MDFSTILVGLYLLVVGFAACMTWAEQRQTAARSRVFTPLAYLLCAFWPLAVVALLVSLQFDRMALARQPGL